MAKRSAKPASPPLHVHQVLWLLACAVATLAPHLAYAPLWLSTAAAVLIAWRVYLWWQRRPLPSKWLLSALVIAGSIGVFLTFRHFFGKDPGVALLILFLTLKLMESRTVRDGMTVIFLCYFLQFSLFTQTQSFSMAALMLLLLVLITAALISLNHSGRKPIANLRLAGTMLAQAVPFMLVLFVLFPRIQGPLWGLPSDAYSGLSGLSDTMSPGSISNLSLSDAIAFRVRFSGTPPQQNALYWRGPVLSQFDGKEWRPERVPAGPVLPYAVSGTPISYTVTLEPHNKPWLFALEMPAMLPPNSTISDNYQLLAKDPVRTRLRYEMQSLSNFNPGIDEDQDTLRGALQLPTGYNPRSRALAAEWRTRINSDTALVQQALNHFRSEPFAYTLRPPLLGENSVDEFLFESRRGFCEHYAASFVVLMRAAGIPARVVTGYQGGEINPVDQFLEVRQADAHAWAEVWLDGRGWVRVDPTAAVAPSRIERSLAMAVPSGDPLPFLARAEFSWLKTVRFRWDALANTWNQWVLGYNAERQRSLLSQLGMENPDWRGMTSWLTTLMGILMLALTAWTLHQRARIDRIQRAWNKLSDKMARRGIGLARKPWEGPADYARRVGEEIGEKHPSLAGDLMQIAKIYIGLRYGKQTENELLRLLETKIAEIKT